MEVDGWHPDPFGVHEQRLFRDGEPTQLVKDDGIGRLDPVSIAERRALVGVDPSTSEVGVDASDVAVRAPEQAVVAASPWQPYGAPPDGGRSWWARRLPRSARPVIPVAAVLLGVGLVLSVFGLVSGGAKTIGGPSGTARSLAHSLGGVPRSTLTSLELALSGLPKTTTLSRLEQELQALPKGTSPTSVVSALHQLPPTTTVSALQHALRSLPASSSPKPTTSHGTAASSATHAPVTQAAPSLTPGTAPPIVGPTPKPASAPHVMVVLMENESSSSVVGNSQMPFTSSLAAQYGLATQSFALAHPSLPDYLDLVSGSNQGVTVDESPSASGVFNHSTLATQLAAAGFSAKAYAENLPADPSNDSGEYAVRHNPWEYFSPANTLPVADSTQLVGDLNSPSPPDFVWYTPNMIDDEHDGTPAQADAFLRTFVTGVRATSWYAAGGQIIIEYDEGASSDSSGINGGNGGHVATIVVSAALKASPAQSGSAVDTAGVLHSIEDAYGLTHLGGSGADGTIDALLHR